MFIAHLGQTEYLEPKNGAGETGGCPVGGSAGEIPNRTRINRIDLLEAIGIGLASVRAESSVDAEAETAQIDAAHS